MAKMIKPLVIIGLIFSLILVALPLHAEVTILRIPSSVVRIPVKAIENVNGEIRNTEYEIRSTDRAISDPVDTSAIFNQCG